MSWHKMDWENPSELKDHHYYLVTHKKFKTPMKAKWHEEMGGSFEVIIGGLHVNEVWHSWDFDNPIIAWMEMPDIYREEQEVKNEPK